MTGVWLHMAVALATVAAALALVFRGVQRLRGRAVRLPAEPLFVLATLTALIGLVIYPHDRVFVRGLLLDRDAPWASNLFDVKENLALFSLPLAGSCWALESEDQAPRLSLLLGGLSAASLLFCTVAGLVVRNAHP